MSSILALLLTGVLGWSGCGDDSAPSDGGRTDAAARDAGRADAGSGPGATCAAAGGTCDCAGGCATGSHPAEPPLRDMCPQPCDGCGACSQWCCLPDEPLDAGAAAACGEETCTGDARCIRPCCGGPPVECVPLPDGGACAPSATPCSLPGGGDGCATPCTPPAPYCSEEIPAGCELEGEGDVVCLCA